MQADSKKMKGPAATPIRCRPLTCSEDSSENRWPEEGVDVLLDQQSQLGNRDISISWTMRSHCKVSIKVLQAILVKCQNYGNFLQPPI